MIRLMEYFLCTQFLLVYQTNLTTYITKTRALSTSHSSTTVSLLDTTTKTSTSPRDTSTRPTRVAIGKWTKETKRPATGSSSHHNFTKTTKPTTLITTGGLVGKYCFVGKRKVEIEFKFFSSFILYGLTAEPLNLVEQATRFDLLSAATREAELTRSNLREFQIKSNPNFKTFHK